MVFWYNFHCNVYAPSHLFHHYSDVIMRAMASQVTSLTIVYSTVYSGGRSNKTSKLRVTGLCEVNSPVTGEFTTQRASNAANVSIWWRHHGVMSMRNTCNVISALVVVETQIEKYMAYGELGLPRMPFGHVWDDSSTISWLAQSWLRIIAKNMLFAINQISFHSLYAT